MNRAGEYRSYAAAAVRLARKSDDDVHKARMLKIAQGWLELAEHVEKRVPIWKQTRPRVADQASGKHKH
jgi:hypothetical protein